MSKLAIPNQVRTQVDEIVQSFNARTFNNTRRYYDTRYRGAYVYFDRYHVNAINKVFRLEYTGNFDDWKFAVYKHSTQSYDANEWFFPGAGHVNGTIEGALKAGLEAYP